jgi:hypothetical protein
MRGAKREISTTLQHPPIAKRIGKEKEKKETEVLYTSPHAPESL